MRRREALKAIAMFPFLISPMLGGESKKVVRRKRLIKPKRLSKGDTIAIIAPASGASDSEFEYALQNLADLGFKTKVGKYARGGSGFLAGTDEERLHDLHWRLVIMKLTQFGVFVEVMERLGFCRKLTTR